MADRGSNNHCGRGLPPYLLWRQDSGSTIYSDGASRIFVSSRSVTSDKDTSYSSASIDAHTLSSVSSWLTGSEFDKTKRIENSSGSGVSVNDPKHSSISLGSSSVSSCKILSTHIGSVGTTTVRNSTHSSKNNGQVARNFTASISSGSSISFFTPSLGPLPDHAENNNCSMNEFVTYNTYPGVYTDPENMFTPYVSVFSESQDLQREKSPG